MYRSGVRYGLRLRRARCRRANRHYGGTVYLLATVRTAIGQQETAGYERGSRLGLTGGARRWRTCGVEDFFRGRKAVRPARRCTRRRRSYMHMLELVSEIAVFIYAGGTQLDSPELGLGWQ